MTTTNGNLVIIGLGTTNVKYYWKGTELQGVVKIFVSRGVKLTMTVLDKTKIPAEVRASGIRIKEKR